MDRPFSSPSGRQDAPLSFICYTVAAHAYVLNDATARTCGEQDAPLSFICYTVAALAFLFFIAPIRDLAAGTARAWRRAGRALGFLRDTAALHAT